MACRQPQPFVILRFHSSPQTPTTNFIGPNFLHQSILSLQFTSVYISKLIMAGGTITDKLSLLLGPSPSAIFFALFVALCAPIALHLYIYRAISRRGLSTFMLAGPSGSGKTALHAFVSINRSSVCSMKLILCVCSSRPARPSKHVSPRILRPSRYRYQ